MSDRGLMRTAMWTELLEALRKDFPDVKFPDQAGAALSGFVKSNADYMHELIVTKERLRREVAALRTARANAAQIFDVLPRFKEGQK